MRTLNGVYREIVVQVRSETPAGEYVFISGNSPELGEWKVSNAVMLSKVSSDGNIWGGVIKVSAEKNIYYRYLTCVMVDKDGKQENIVRHWESHLKPRMLQPTDFINGKCDIDVFGYQDDVECVSSGWLTAETIVQLKMFNNPITIWKRKYREKRISMHVSTIDITRKESDLLGIEDDSTSPEGVQSSCWPIVEVAQMNEAHWQFSSQSQFGVMYNPLDYVIFQAQMLEPDTIALLRKG